MAAGGTAPISRSRVMPPTFPAANASTITPKMSRRYFTAATAPLSANTNVPPRSRTVTRMWVMLPRPVQTTWNYTPTHPGAGYRIASSRQPRLRGHHQRLDAGFQRRMDHGQEARIVVGGDLVDAVRRLGPGVDIRVGAAHEPEHRRDAPFGAKRSEILARRCRSGLVHTIGREVLAKCFRNALARSAIVDRERITVQRRDLRRFRCARGCRLGIDDALD